MLRNNFPSQLKKNNDQLIFDNIKRYLKKYFWKKHIAIYWSIKSEVDTRNVISWLLKNKYYVYLPKITNKDSNDMEFINIKTLDFLSEMIYEIAQPKDTKYVDPKSLDIIFIPLICFDKHKNRIGMGKGFYDKYLTRTYATKIGLAYQIQETFYIQTEKSDVRLDKIITENGES